MKPFISMISLGVSDLNASIAFYQTGLGFPRMEPYDENIAFFTLNATWLALYEKKALAEDANIAFDGSQFHMYSTVKPKWMHFLKKPFKQEPHLPNNRKKHFGAVIAATSKTLTVICGKSLIILFLR